MIRFAVCATSPNSRFSCRICFSSLSGSGVFGGHAAFGTNGRYWEFASPGRGKIDFEGIIRQLNHSGYGGPLTVEWEDPGMHREHGARESAEFCRKLDFEVSPQAFDSAFAED